MKETVIVISGSNRKDNLTFHFAKYAYEQLKQKEGIKTEFVDFSNLEAISVGDGIYNKDHQPETIKTLQDSFIIPATRFWFFVPEYNGSYPGIVKLVLDSLSVRDYKESFDSKKACITGIASGRAGNLRGMDHLADVLNHLGIYVHPNKTPISSIYKYLDGDKNVTDGVTEVLDKQMEQLLSF